MDNVAQHKSQLLYITLRCSILQSHQLSVLYSEHRQLLINPLNPHNALKHHFTIPENRLNFPTTRGLRMKISMRLVYQYMAIIFNFSPTSNHLHPLRVENCDSNSRLVVDENKNGKFRRERVKATHRRLIYR